MEAAGSESEASRKDNVKAIISKNTRIRHPDKFQVGHFSIIDDFCYFSTQVIIGRGSHIASGCSIGGGIKFLFKMGDFSSLSSGVKVWCSSNNYAEDIVAIVPEGIILENLHNIDGDVILEDYTAVGANTVIMPGNTIPEGTVIGALSYVPFQFSLDPWTVYAGIPVHPVGKRNRKNVLIQVEEIKHGLGF